MQRVVYIVGCGHSGSTLLDLILGAHSKFVGLGEVMNLVRPGGVELTRKNGAICSCGKTIDACEFWSKVASQPNGQLNADQRYQNILNTFKELYGKECAAVDSSKELRPLQMLLKNPELEIKVIHLIKDVRAYTISLVDRAKIKKVRGKSLSRRSKRLPDFILRHPLYHFRLWYSQNKKMQQFLQKHDIPTLQIGYEELCIYPDKMIRRICEFLGEEPEDSMLSLSNSNGSHVIRGNRMRNRSERKKIMYDNRWFYRTEWVLPSIIFPGVMKFNRREVYKNTGGTVWEEKS